MNSTKTLKITTLAENTASHEMLGQWGLSFLLELLDGKGDKRKVIFDTGINKEALLFNIKQLKINLNDVDAIVLSHGHLDHTATTVEIAKIAKHAKIYAHPHVFLPRFYENKQGKRRQIGVPNGEGLDDIEKTGGKVLFKTEPAEIVPGVWTTGQIRRVTSFERALPLSEGEKLIMVTDGEEVEDNILDDQALWMNIEGIGPLVITGCAHAGIINTLLHVQRIGNFKQLYGLVGGSHLVGRSDDYFQKTTNELKQFALKLISPCHCTGFKAMTKLWQAFPEAFVLNFSGRIIEAGKEPETRVA
jgi:7,8-dihydropterin-6-yl-methyl-4-(beta-D-ribofuranosyl)aminobenzene 5'-phosphate synthase